jgi:hypothetical protein
MFFKYAHTHTHTMYFILVTFVTATDKKLYFQIWAFLGCYVAQTGS